MRKTLLSITLFLFAAIAAYAQAPQMFNYQGVARNVSGAPLANQAISLRLTIHDVSAAGTILYQESHAVTTNPYGLYMVSVGTGTNTTGTFSTINWGSNPKYMQVEVDPAGGTSFGTLGSSQLASVPYAVYSNTAGTATNATNLTGTVPMSGDVTGTNAAASVVKLQGNDISTTTPTAGQVLLWNNTTGSWQPTTLPINGDVTGTNGATTVTKLQGHSVSAAAPSAGEVLAWNSGTSAWEPNPAGSGTVTSLNAGTGIVLSPNPITTTGTVSLSDVGTPGVYGSATMVPVITTDPQGRVTSIVNTPITVAGSGTMTSVTAGPGLTATPNPITVAGTVDLPFIGTPGTYGSSTQIPVFTLDAYGRVTAVTDSIVKSSDDSGTVNYISKFTGTNSLRNSAMYQLPTGEVGLGTLTPQATFDAESATDTMAGNFIISGGPAPGNGVLNAAYTGTSTTGPSVAIIGTSLPDITVSQGLGVGGIGGSLGVSGVAESLDGAGFPTAVQGQSFGDGVVSAGVAGFANAAAFGSDNNYGVYGQTDGSGLVNDFAGEFAGALDCSGDFTCGGTKFFKMDDPIDPANKFLYHSCVESDEMMNIYAGNITTDASGVATVILPDYFEALNKDFRYQLTVIGTFAQAIIGEKVNGNKFVIKTNQPNVEVSWQVTGVRHDAYASAHPMKTEVEKNDKIKGMYIHPELYGKSMDLQIGRLNAKPLKNMKAFSSVSKNQHTNSTGANKPDTK